MVVGTAGDRRDRQVKTTECKIVLKFHPDWWQPSAPSNPVARLAGKMFTRVLNAAPAVLLALLLHHLVQPPPTGAGLCPPHGPARAECHFSEGYFEARDKFRRAAEAAGADLHSLLVVPEGGYSMDIAVISGQGAGLVVHSSGVHGVEGYAGSAIQLAALEKFAARRAERDADPDAPTVVIVHAVNPFGMAHFRRFNEHNVDLNRNALPPDALKAALARDPNVAGYFDFAELLNPSRPPTLWDAYVSIPLRSLWLLARFGLTHMKRALVTAQYTDPKGIFYGGRRLEPSHALLFDWFGRFAATEGGAGRKRIRAVTWIDVHTGLGRPGEDTLLTNEPVKMFRRWYPDAPKVQSESEGEGDVAAGYELTVGFHRHLFSTRFADEQRLQHFTQEFGTQKSIMVARAMILENQAFHYARAEHARWSAFSRDAFYVREAWWKRSIVARGLAVLEQAEARSRALAGEP
jgi:hypothetical protein